MGHHEEGQLAFFAVVGFSRSGTISVSGVRVWEREREREREREKYIGQVRESK